MEAFYEFLADGASPEDALVAAKRAMRQRDDDPRLWANYVLISRAAPAPS